MNRRPAQLGFTLLELVLVMVIIAIALAAAAPKLRGWSRGQELREAADQFVYFTRYARAQAASDGTTYRVSIDPQANTYSLLKLEGDKFVPATFDYGDAQRLPDGYRIQVIQQQAAQNGQTATTIDFYPSGRTQVATVRFLASTGDGLTVSCAAAAEQFAVATGEVQQ